MSAFARDSVICIFQGHWNGGGHTDPRVKPEDGCRVPRFAMTLALSFATIPQDARSARSASARNDGRPFSRDEPAKTLAQYVVLRESVRRRTYESMDTGAGHSAASET